MKIFGLLIIVLLSCVILSNGKQAASFLEPNCGSVAYTYSSRIANGETANILEHPWMAFVSSRTVCDPPRYLSPGEYCLDMCGGSLITNRFVLSAAHCTFNQYTRIKLGEFRWKESTANGIELPAIQKINHPQYYHDPYNTMNDIGLYKLAWAVTYTNYIRPVCLPTNFNPLAQTSYLTATGWGRTEYGYSSDELRKGTMPQWDRSYCGINGDMSKICSGGSSGTSTCLGDSGGPVTGFYLNKGTYIVVQLGIVSYGGLTCPSTSVFTNVMHYVDWIKNIVGRGGRSQNNPAPNQKWLNNYNRWTTRAPFRWITTTAAPYQPPLYQPPNNFIINWFYNIPNVLYRFKYLRS